jgi:ATP-binding cassette, subfamily C, bacterial LapB
MTQAPESSLKVDELYAALARLASMQREAVDRLALQEAVSATNPQDTAKRRLTVLSEHLQINNAKWRTKPDAADLPALVAKPNGQWAVLKTRNGDGQWVCETFDLQTRKWEESLLTNWNDYSFASMRLAQPFKASESPVMGMVVDEIKANKGRLFEGAAGGLLITVMGVLVSFYTMQVYDRVIPTGASQTLTVLTMGVLLVIVMEYAAKRLRSHVYESLVDIIDQRLARTVYLRFLSVRLDQMPQSVGTLASQLRGYETVRGFLISLSSQLTVDAPFALGLLLVIWFIAGPLVIVPAAFVIVALGVAMWHSTRIRGLMDRGHDSINRKNGLLVESVEAAEIIKSGQGGWRMLGRWLASSDESRVVDLETRRLTEAGQYRSMALQQFAYITMVATGALMASNGQLTMGSLIACTILSSRVFTPATQLSSQLTQWAHVKSALKGLDAIWKLEGDHHGHLQPVHIETLKGNYRFENAVMTHLGRPALAVEKLQIFAGEKIAVVGPIGAGKTTLLRLLSGMYKPTEGRVWLDDIDLEQISKPKLAESIGYLPQEGRLLAGTVRENLTLGLADPGDDVLIEAAKATGLFDAVITGHPQGLEMPINEGGTGLSGGQRQLVNLTRVFLRKPKVWLLDEPTASLDRTVEQHIVNTLKNAMQASDTLVLVTHKPELLRLVDRVIVVAKHQVIMDGPRDEVLMKLKQSPVAGDSATRIVKVVK